jgi:NAD(P)-dependent dehydrogenase (short-subunit alcohol dehydrogenase family)
LVNNTAAMVLPIANTTVEGYELQFGVNFLDHFALSGRLYPLLHATPEARVVTVSSMGYLGGCLDFTNLRLEKGYDGLREYRQSKLANLLFAHELQRRLAATDGQVQSLAVQPGANRTSSAVNINAEYLAAAEKRWGGPAMEPWQGRSPCSTRPPRPAAANSIAPTKTGAFGLPRRSSNCAACSR